MTDQPALLPDEALLKSLEAAASKGEWTTHSQFGQIVDANGRSIGSVSFFGHGEEQAESNRAFVVAARNMVPVLLGRLDRTRAELDALKTKLRYYFDCEQAMFEGMHTGGQTLAAGPFDEMQETERELREMVGWPVPSGDAEGVGDG